MQTQLKEPKSADAAGDAAGGVAGGADAEAEADARGDKLERETAGTGDFGGEGQAPADEPHQLESGNGPRH